MNERLVSMPGDVKIENNDNLVMEDDRIFDVPFLSEVCTSCEHFNWNVDRTCTAFPNGIPLKIWNGEDNHEKPFSGDNGVQFKRRKV